MKLFFLIFIIILFSSFLLSPMVLADCCCSCTINDKSTQIGDGTETAADCTDLCNTQYNTVSAGCPEGNCPGSGGDSNSQIIFKNPLTTDGKPLANPQDLWARLITVLLGFVGVASLVAFVYAGFMFLVSAGNQERVKKAKDIMLYAVIGVFVAMASYAILSFAFTILEKGTGNV